MDGQHNLLVVLSQKTLCDSYMNSHFEMCPSQLKRPTSNLSWFTLSSALGKKDEITLH